MIKKEKHMHTIYLKESRNMHRRYELIVKMCLFNSQFIPLYQIKREKKTQFFFTEKKCLYIRSTTNGTAFMVEITHSSIIFTYYVCIVYIINLNS